MAGQYDRLLIALKQKCSLLGIGEVQTIGQALRVQITKASDASLVDKTLSLGFVERMGQADYLWGLDD